MKEQNPLMPLIKRCRKERGLKSRVLRMMWFRGVPGNWANLSEWLHPNETRRRIPKETTLTGLLAIMKELDEDKKC